MWFLLFIFLVLNVSRRQCLNSLQTNTVFFLRHPQHNYIMKDFTLLIALYHGLELLVQHGSRVFLNFFDEHPEKSWIQTDDQLTALLERLRDDLGINPLSLDRSILPDGTVPEVNVGLMINIVV